jgi:diadenosine tetraphosphatase ApaH/serine/threonine PP2A family protein phosphatase
LITDLHANREAFEAVLADARAWGYDQLALLGDFVGYGGDPAWLLDTLQPLVSEGAIVVMGNHDQAVAQGALPSMREDARLAVEWTRSQLNAEQLNFLARLPLTVKRDNCLFVHANAFAPAEFDYIQGRAEAVRSMQATQSTYTFCGHMHDPMLYHLSGTGKAGEFTPVPGIEIPLMANRQWLVVPGACGQPRDGNPAACYARFDTQTALLSFQRIPYDHEAAAARILASGLPAAVAQRLADRLNQGT